jgi:poly(ADP-ribose) glycohydrolase ARH3
MRVTPVALWTAGRRADTAELAHRSARVTHHHPGAVEGAVAQAVAVAVALRHSVAQPVDAVEFAATVRVAVIDRSLAAKLDLAAELSQQGKADEIVERIGSGILASESVPSAICAFLSHPQSFTDAVTLAISLGGDADTIASMTGALSGALLGETSISTRWLKRTTVTTRVRDLADALYSVAVRASPSSQGS